MAYEIVITVIFALFGACAASFINAGALRRAKGESNVKGRSRCPKCGQTLSWWELIPILSWLLVMGKCGSCDKPISPRYLLTELICAFFSAMCYVRYGISYMTPLSFGVIVILLAIALIDLSTMEIPDKLVIALVPFAFASVFLQPEITIIPRVVGIIVVSLPMLVLALVIPGAFGGGDIKLMAVCGLMLGWRSTLVATFIALLVGGGIAISKMLRKKAEKGAHMPFGPHLCLGSAAALLYGLEIYTWYIESFIP